LITSPKGRGDGARRASLWESALIFLVLFQLMWFGVFHGLMEEDWNTLWDKVIRCAILMVWFRAGLSRHGKEIWFSGFIHPLGYLLILIGLWKVVGAFWTVSPLVVLESIEDHFWLVCFFLVTYDAVRLPGMRNAFLSTWPIILLLGVSYGFYQWMWAFPEMRREVESMEAWSNPMLYQRWLIRVNSDEVFGLRFYPNLFGLFCAMGAIGILLAKRKSLIHMFIGGMCFWGVMVSGSKSALIFGLGVSAIFLINRYFTGGRRYVVSSIFILTTCLMAWVMWPRLEASVVIRWEYWKATWNMLLSHPFGVGIGVFSQWYPSFMGPDATEVSLPHNDHLQVLVEQGWLGGCLHMAFWGTLIWMFFNQNSHVDDQRDERSLMAHLKLAFLALLIYLFIFCDVFAMGPMDLPIYGIPFLFTLGCLGYWGILRKRWSGDSIFIGGMLLLFLSGSFVDFPMEDGSLLALLFALVLASIPSTEKENFSAALLPLKWILSGLLVLIGVATAWVHQERVIVKNIIATTELEKLVHFDVASIKKHNKLSFWREIHKKTMGKMELSPSLSALRLSSLEFLTEEMPGKANLWEDLGYLRTDLELRKIAWLKAVSLSPMQPRHAFNLGMLYLELNEEEEAKQWFSLALERHRYAKSKLESTPDMELHLLQVAHVQKAETFVIP